MERFKKQIKTWSIQTIEAALAVKMVIEINVKYHQQKLNLTIHNFVAFQNQYCQVRFLLCLIELNLMIFNGIM